MAAVVYLVRDLFFVAKISETADQLGMSVERAANAEALHCAAPNARLVVIDLRLPEALPALEALAADPRTRGVTSIGFVDHENVDVMRAATARGCRTVLSKQRFSAQLPALLAAERAES
jgi:DNA-binding NarL/FixJ family response regulator